MYNNSKKINQKKKVIAYARLLIQNPCKEIDTIHYERKIRVLDLEIFLYIISIKLFFIVYNFVYG